MNAAPAAICQPAPAFAAMRAAGGGENWVRVGETTAFGTASISGLNGTGRFDTDLATGRSARRFTIRVMGSFADVFDGHRLWAQDISGGVHPRDSAFPRALALTDAYLARRGYDDPRTDAQFTCLGTRREANRQVTVIRVQPRHGIPAELSIDNQTHLLDRVTERFPIETQVTDFSDYRAVHGVVLPFSIASGSSFEPKDGFVFNVARYSLRRNAVPADFAPPVARGDVAMIGRVASTTVPMTLEGRQLLVDVSIDGHAPLPFILDTGGHAILTTLAAKALGLRGSGSGESGGSGAGTIALQYTRVASVRIGRAELRDQPFLVIPYPYSFYERGPRTPLAGIMGLEVFERFAMRLDFAHRRVVLAPLRSFRYGGGGKAVGVSFQDDMPMVEAAADGERGLFGVDTGNSGPVILFGTFLARTGLGTRYPAGIPLLGQGTGGVNAARLEELRRFAFGPYVLGAVPTAFTRMRSGSFSSWTEAGNIGLSVLSRFTPTFDYANERLYLEPIAQPASVPANHSGMGFVKNEPAAFDVTLVTVRSPAAGAGVVAGDRIVAVNGAPATRISRADLFDMTLRSRATLHLRVEHGKTTRDVTLAWP